jgi:class 3 adenylate cyclase
MSAQTFLFADLAGFTALTEAHGDEQAADLVEEFSREAASLLPRHAGEQVKVIGDALMLRVPAAAEAIRLGLELTGGMMPHHGYRAIRVGMHYGPALRRGRDWFGATVNLAADLRARRRRRGPPQRVDPQRRRLARWRAASGPRHSRAAQHQSAGSLVRRGVCGSTA